MKIKNNVIKAQGGLAKLGGTGLFKSTRNFFTNLGIRRKFAFSPRSSTGSLGFTAFASPKAELGIVRKDTVSPELFGDWLSVSKPTVYEDVMRKRRSANWKQLLANLNFEKPLTPEEIGQIKTGDFNWIKRHGYISPSEIFIRDDLPFSLKENSNIDMYKAIDMMYDDAPISTKFDYPMTEDYSGFFGKINELLDARDEAYQTLKHQAQKGRLSPLRMPTFQVPDTPMSMMMRTIPKKVGFLETPTTATRLRKPFLHFLNSPLETSAASRYSTQPYAQIGLNNVLGTNSAKPEYDPIFVVGHEVGHFHPAYNTELPDGVYPTDSRYYRMSYDGINPEIKTHLTPKAGFEPNDWHSLEHAEQFSDKLGEDTLFRMSGIKRDYEPYTDAEIEALHRQFKPTRFQLQHPDLQEQKWLLNEAWRNGGKLPR